MSNIISREKAYKVLTEYYHHKTEIQHKALKEALDRVPSAEPERKKGKWIKVTGMMPPEYHGHHCCSECGNFANMKPPFGNREDLSSFCPSCGVDMRGEAK